VRYISNAVHGYTKYPTISGHNYVLQFQIKMKKDKFVITRL